ncbi:MAG: heme biosynthesis HemY N-terminal domain-containing protein [Thiobacillus sp.]|jgi:HemY protein|uniref:heme biosynthesis HemY N-terminal domain-containing protein n=1 Tax=Thiobacillus sp. TaxID=924 RepID=UPI0028948038|nr:heme biosynthesis HemY N-terminal domain-containing protein [Thiobacillus sp.]MDT3705849.1 heme biosynthesis HemY N-terminal domain-containing protein [Thiobacillus sp.]
MRWLVSLLIIVVLAVALAMAGRYDPGYVVLVYPPWRAEISFISFVMILVVLVVSGVLLLRLAALTLNLPSIVRAQRERRAAARRDENFVGGLRAYVECRYQDAEQALGQWQGDAPRLGLARVLAARAAQEMRALPQRERHLRDAAEHGSGLAAQLFEAEARLDAKDAVAALAAINRAKGIAPQHTALLRLELKARQMTGQWDEVERLLDALTRSNALESGVAAQMRRMAYAENLKRRAGDNRSLLEYWKKIPADFKVDPWVARAAARAFLQDGHHDTALDVLEAALNRSWHEDLVALYGEARGSNPVRQIEQAERWLHAHPRDAQLLLTLAQLCSAQQLWGKAQSYLEASLAIAASAEGHIRMAELKTRSGQPGEACQHYQKALALCREE